MKKKSMLTRFLPVWVLLLLGMRLLGQNINCPTTITNGLYLNWTNQSPPPEHNSTTSKPELHLFGSSGGPCNGVVTFSRLLNNPLSWRGDCNVIMPSGSITLFANSGNQICYYEGGVLVDHPVNPPLSPINCSTFATCENIMAFALENFQAPAECKQWNGPCNSGSEISRPGKVSIGTKKPAPGFQLTVKGGITTQQLKICKTEWCDYVFADTFSRMGLRDVDAYIQANKHLPGCPSGQSIADGGGFFLDEETRNHQRKIEEIYLHLIGLDRRLDSIDALAPKRGWWRNLFSSKHKGSKPLEAINERARNADFGPMTLQCTQLASATSASGGTAGVLVTGGVAPFTVSWTPQNGSFSSPGCDGFIKIPNLPAGNYTITVKDANNVSASCAMSIYTGIPIPVSCAIFQDPLCRASILQNIQNALPHNQSCKQWDGDDCSSNLKITRTGRVGMGTTNVPSGFGLAVKGGIICDTRFRVELCSGWCDYVFDKTHKMMPLPAMGAYIREYKHLPGSITQAQVTQAEGFDVGAAKLDHQEKIEEAFLHLIALNEKVKNLQKRVEQSK